jgi:hypothetical protein
MTYHRLTSFMASFFFIPIVFAPWVGFQSDLFQLFVIFNDKCGLRDHVITRFTLVGWCGPFQKHQPLPIICSKWLSDSIQDKGIKRGIECIGFKGFDQVNLKGPLEYQEEEALVYLIHVQEGPNPTLLGPWDEEPKETKESTTTWKQHGCLPFPFVYWINGLHTRL